MKPRGFLLLLACICLLTPSSTDGQWLEETIWLPDSFGGLIYPRCAVADTARNKVYIAGGDKHSDDSFETDYLYHWVVVLDAVSLQRIARVEVPEEVNAMCYNPVNGRVYASHRHTDNVSVIDCATDSVIATLPVGRYPTTLCYNPQENKVYCGSWFDNTVSVFDGATNQLLATLPVTGRIFGLYYAGTNTVFCVTDANTDGYVYAIDGSGDTLRNELLFDAPVTDGCWNQVEKKFYCLVWGVVTELVVVSGLGDSVLTRLYVGRTTTGFGYNPANNRVYCPSWDDSVWVVDCSADTLLTVFTTPEFHPGRITFSPRSNRAYCQTDEDDPNYWRYIMVLDCSGDSFLKFLPTGEHPLYSGYDPKFNRFYCLNNWTDDVTVVDCGGDSVLATVGVGLKPEVLEYVPDLHKLYVGGRSFERVVAIDAETNRVLAEIPAGNWVEDMCYNPVLRKLYVGARRDDSLTVIDCVGDTVVARVPVMSGVRHLLYLPVGNGKVYCTNEDRSHVYIVDCATDSMVFTLAVSGPALNMVYNPVANKVYCGVVQRSVAVIDPVIDRVIARFGVPSEPLAVNTVSNKVYACTQFVDIADCETDSVIARIDTVRASFWAAGCYNPIDNKVYLTSAPFTNDLMVVDGSTDTVIALIPEPGGGGYPIDVLHNPMNNKVYFTVSAERGVGVMDGASDSLLAVLSVGDAPWALAWNPIQNRVYVAEYMGSSIAVIRDSVVPGVSENLPTRKVTGRPGPTIVGAVLHMPETEMTNARYPMALLDISGRQVAELLPGENDVRHLSPGVYFVREKGPRSQGSEGQSRKVILTH